MAIEQIKIGFDNFCYVIYCKITKNAAIIDPGYDPSKILKFITSKKLILKYIILTHHHTDHTNECFILKKTYPTLKVIISKIESKYTKIPIDIKVKDNQRLNLGKISLKFILTPGHTPGSICIIVDNKAILTGDTLFIGDCGRIELPGGNLNQMYYSLMEKIMKLPDDLILYPGHDYGQIPYDTLGNQKNNFISYFKDVIHIINNKNTN